MNINYTKDYKVTVDFFNAYMSKKKDEFHLDGVGTQLTLTDNHTDIIIVTTQDLTPTELSDLNTYILNYSDFDQGVVDMATMEAAKAWGRKMINEFELKNMNRKAAGSMGRAELLDILAEAHDSYVFITMLEGSLGTLHGILNGFPEETINDALVPARAPFSFATVWQEDIDWIKAELNLFLAGA